MSAEPILATPVTGPAVIRQRLSGMLPALSLLASRGLSMGAQLAVQIAVGALSGPVGLGVLQLFTAWSSVLGEALARGWPPMAMKQVAVAWDRQDRSRCASVTGGAWWAILRVALPLAALAVVLAMLATNNNAWAADGAGRILALTIPIAAVGFALLRLGSEVLKAIDSPLSAVTLENLAIPAVVLLLCLGCLIMSASLSSTVLVLAALTGLMLGVTGVCVAINRRLGGIAFSSSDAQVNENPKERRALWLSAVLAIGFLQFPFLVLPLFTDLATIGVYAVAHKLMNIITTLLLLLASVFGPKFARTAARGDRPGLSKLLSKTQWISLAMFVPAAILLIAVSDHLADWFHVPRAELQVFLLIFVLGQVINAATGLAGILLAMTGGASTEWRISLLAFLLMAIATPFVGSIYGANGLALLFSLVIAAKNLASWLAARRHLSEGILTT